MYISFYVKMYFFLAFLHLLEIFYFTLVFIFFKNYLLA